VSNDRAYMNAYMKRRWSIRRKVAIHFLGDKCATCGTTIGLEFDHVDPAAKEASVASLSSASEERFWREIAKCQLLCRPCHKERHAPPHGTRSRYVNRKCRCDECRAANRKAGS